jgi:hypothetical protein
MGFWQSIRGGCRTSCSLEEAMKSGSRRLSVALVAALALAMSGCGSSSDGAGNAAGPDESLSATPIAQVTAAPPADAKVIGVSVTADSVSPSGTKVSVKRDQPIVFEIDAAEAGELHVHSSPAKAIEYPAGKSQVQISIDKPGVIEAEIEDTGDLVVQLEVR